MQQRIVADIPGRIRIAFSLPRFPALDRGEVESRFREISGVRKASFSPRTGTLLVSYDGQEATRQAVLEKGAAAWPPPTDRAPAKKELARKKRIFIRSGALVLAWPFIPLPLRPLVAIWEAFPIFKKGLTSLRKGRLDVDVLDVAGVGAALATREFLTVSLITLLQKLGDYLQEWTRGESRRLLSQVYRLGQEWAWVIREGVETQLPLEEVAEGDTVVVRMGGLIPVDGVVLEGEALVNQSRFTEKALPVTRREGLSVFAGTHVEEGWLRIRARRVGDKTRTARVLKMIEEAEEVKAETQSKGEALADRTVPWSFIFSGLTLLFTGSAARAIAVLQVDYSCAITLSTPLAILTSLAHLAGHRVLVKGGKYLERLARADAFVLNKAGILTSAAPEVVEVVSFQEFDQKFLLREAACVEEHFPHPVATAVVRRAACEGLLHTEDHADVEYILSHGIASHLAGQRIIVGSRHFVHEDEGVDISAAAPFVDSFAEKGESVLYVAVGGRLAGLIVIHDPLREDARGLLRGLKEMGVAKIVMLTGDDEATARPLAAQLGMDEYYAQALPDEKVALVKRLQREGYTVAMVGGGINDFAALARADVGITLSHGADITREVCGVLLLEENLGDILEARAISQEAMALIKSNFRAIIAFNSATLLLSVTGALPPVVSAVLHNLSTVFFGLRSLKPLRGHR
ncbi:MAG: heavy metal translocating P-type ATPase [Deltaproteobacteria bacterium]|nr:heavy metal translocating P-type ATPase [Deltaproteobacteria bacterium]